MKRLSFSIAVLIATMLLTGGAIAQGVQGQAGTGTQDTATAQDEPADSETPPGMVSRPRPMPMEDEEVSDSDRSNPLERAFGLGYDVDLGGVTFRYMLDPDLGLDATIGFGMETARADGEQFKFDFDFAFKAIFPIVTVEDRFRLNVTPGLFMQYVGNHVEDADGEFNLSLFAGLAPELFIWDGLAVEVMFGLAINLQRINSPNDQDFYLNAGTIGNGVSIVSGLLFHWYFE